MLTIDARPGYNCRAVPFSSGIGLEITTFAQGMRIVLDHAQARTFVAAVRDALERAIEPQEARAT